MFNLLAAGDGGYQIFTLHNSEKTWLYFALLCAVASIVVALLLVRGVLAADQGTATMKDIAKAIQEGAEAFLARQFKTIGIIIIPLAVLIFFTATKVTHPVWVTLVAVKNMSTASGTMMMPMVLNCRARNASAPS